MLIEFRDPAGEGANTSPRPVGIIGAAFGAIVSSLIDGVVMPFVGLVHGQIDSSRLVHVSGDPNSVPVAARSDRRAVTSNIGLFINAVVNSSVSPLVCFSSSRALTV